jgi:hypothetical protein
LGRPHQRLPQFNAAVHQVVADVAQQQDEDALVDAARCDRIGVLPMGADQNRGSRDLFGQGLGRVDLGGHRLDERQGEVIQGGLDGVVAAAECVVHGAA